MVITGHKLASVMRGVRFSWRKAWISLPKISQASLYGLSISRHFFNNTGKHVWGAWNQLNKKLKARTEVKNRHSYYSISNWDFLGAFGNQAQTR